jgi:uncharacterized protein
VKANRLTWTFLLLLTVAVQLPAQQSEADSKLLADLRAKAEKGDAESQNKLGRTFFSGTLGVETNYAEAVQWFRKAAEQNYAPAQNLLGVSYHKGFGVAKDEAKAAKWFRKAAEQNNAHAQCDLGVCYAHGQGVAKDYAEAATWFRKAAEQNFADAQNGLGNCYFNGKGVAKDNVEAYKWTLLAAAQGNEEAKKSKIALESLMTREQIEEGQKRARDFKPREGPQPR